MAKNYATIYNSTNDAIAIEQRWYAKRETTKGQLIAPQNTDYFYTLGGGSISYTQPIESSPHRSGRHHTDIIKKKKELTFSFSTYFNIDETLGAASTAEIDVPIRMLKQQMLGVENTGGGSPVFNTSSPADFTFSLFEVGDKWARQGRGCFMQTLNENFPGNGEATMEWGGAGAESFLCGIAKSTTDNNAANTITLQAGEGDRIPVGALIMIIEADGTTRSADTAAGSARTVTAKTGDVITVSGAVLADADGSGVGAPIYISYYEPSAPAAINNPVTGLTGSFVVASTSHDCVRNFSVAMSNDHELVDYCYGSDSLDSPYFVPGSRFTAEVTMELNLNDEILALFNRIQESFEAQDITIVLGSPTGRRYQLEIPKAIFPVPAFTDPETGSIPITFTGTAYQTALDAADEITASYL